MTSQTYIRINGLALPVRKDDDSIGCSDAAADSGGETAAGDLSGCDPGRRPLSVPVSQPVSAVWLKRPGRMKKRTCFSLQYAGTDAHRGKSALSWQVLILC